MDTVLFAAAFLLSLSLAVLDWLLPMANNHRNADDESLEVPLLLDVSNTGDRDKAHTTPYKASRTAMFPSLVVLLLIAVVVMVVRDEMVDNP